MPSNRRATLIALALLALALAPTSRASADIDAVPLDIASGTVARDLPFDVPFALVGDAPPGTTRVSLRYRLGARGGSPLGELSPEEEPIVSGVDAAGRFRLPVPALPPGRDVRLELVVERTLSEAGRRAFHDAVRPLVARVAPQAAEGSLEPAWDAALRDALARSLADGRRGVVLPAPAEVSGGGPLFDSSSAPAAREAEARRLARDVATARRQLNAAAERHGAGVSGLRSALASVAASPDLDALVGALAKDPELDPRNPRSTLALPSDARDLVYADGARLGAIAAGSEAGAAEWVAGTADPAVARDRHRRTAVALGQLRDWLSGLLLPGGGRARVEALVAAASLEAASVPRLAELAGPSGAIARAQTWAESLESAAADAARARAAEDRALAVLAGDIEQQAAAAVVRQDVAVRAETGGGLYVSLDAGVLYAFEADAGSLYLGTSVSFGAVNPRAPLRGSLRRRLSAIVGITLNDMKREDETRFENLIASRWNIVVGLGVRLTRSLRLGAGALLLLKNDPNPLVTDRSLGAVPYVSLSLDVDVARLAGGGER
jgi:hypothetical protein